MAPFESPQKADHPSRRRSVFAKRAFPLGSKKKAQLPPPSSKASNGRKMSIFRSTSFPTNKKKTVISKPSSQARPPAPIIRLPEIKTTNVGPDSQSVTSVVTRDSSAHSVASQDKRTIASSAEKYTTPPQTTQELRSKLKDLGSNNKRCMLLMGQVQVLEEESQRKDEKLRRMNDKLYEIQRGLSQIDEERESLLGQVERLEGEKQNIQKQLDLRETECLTLVKRCTSQEERMKESTLLRCKNVELEQEVKDLKANKADRDSEEKQLEATTRDLIECKQKLEYTKRDHDALANTLHSCLANIKKLTHEKQEWEDERRRLGNRAEVEIEKERLEHLQEMNNLKVELETQQAKVEKLEEFMKDKSMTNLMLRKENSELIKWKTQTSVKMDECERQIVELMEVNGDINTDIAKMNGSTEDMSAKLREKEDIIASLEAEVSTFMSKAMSTSETLEVLQDENAELSGKVEELQCELKQFDGWSQERDAMQQCTSVMQAQISELMEEVVTLQLEKDDLEEENQELIHKTKSVAGSWEKDMTDREVTWRRLEQNLRSQLASLRAEKTVKEERSDEKLKAALETIRSLEWTVAARTKDNLALRQQLDEMIESEADCHNQILSLENNLSAATASSKQHNDEIMSVREQLEEAKKQASNAEDKCQYMEARLLTKESETSSTNRSLKSLQDEFRTSTEHLETKLAEKTRELANADETLKALVAKYSAEKQQCMDETSKENMILTSNNTALEAELDSLHGILRDSKAHIEQVESKVSERENELAVTHSSLESLKEDLRVTTDEFEECIANEEELMRKVTARTCERDLALQEANELRICISNMESQIQSRDSDLKEARAYGFKIQEEMEELASEMAKLRHQISSKDEELGAAQEFVLKQDSDLQSLRSELQKVETETMLKDDEIRDLRLFDLKDKEEEVESLQFKLRAKETEFGNMVEKLEAVTLSQLEREHEVSSEVSKLKTQIATIKREHREKEAEWVATGQDNQELKSNAITQKRRNQLLEKSLESLKREKEMIMASEESALNDKARLEVALQREISIKEEKSKELDESRLTIDTLEKTVSAMSDQKCELAALLDERTRLLGEMVEVNKKLQTSMDSFSDSKEEVNKIRDERDQLAEKLTREQSIREVLEAEAATAHAQIASMRRAEKDKEKLKTENAELLAKIQRQEKFLKKKIQKEKVLRDRSSSLNVLKTPAPHSPRKGSSNFSNRRVTIESQYSESVGPNISIVSEGDDVLSQLLA